MSSARLSRILQLALLSVFELAACALLAELALRAQLYVRGAPYSAQETRAEIAARYAELAETPPALGGVRMFSSGDSPAGILHPFLGWEPESDSGGVLAYFRTRTNADEHAILVLGGSLADEIARTQSERIAARLARDPRLSGHPVRLLDGADPGHKAPQPLLRAAFVLSSGYRPAAVVLVDGFDEIAIAADNASAGVHPVYPWRGGWQPLAEQVGAMEPAELDLSIETWDAHAKARAELQRLSASAWQTESALLGCRARALGVRLFADFQARERELARLSAEFHARRASSPEISGPPFARDDASVIEAGAIAWSEASRSLHALCATRSIPFLHVLQPAREDSAARTHVASANDPPQAERTSGAAIRAGYPRLRELGTALAASEIGFEDESRIFDGSAAERFTGPWQIDATGLSQLADRIAAELLARLPSD